MKNQTAGNQSKMFVSLQPILLSISLHTKTEKERKFLQAFVFKICYFQELSQKKLNNKTNELINKFKLSFRANECYRFYGKSFIIFRPGSLHSEGQGSLPCRQPASAVCTFKSYKSYLSLTTPENGNNKNGIAL